MIKISNIFISLFTFIIANVLLFFFFQFCSTVRCAIAKSLGEIGNGKQEVIDSLIHSLKNDEN